MTPLKILTLSSLPMFLLACGNDDEDTFSINAPDTYAFTSITDPSAPSSVDYKEATTRNVLIKELEFLIGSDYLQEVGQAQGHAAALELLNRIYIKGTLDVPDNLVATNLYNQQSEPTPIMGLTFSSDFPSLQQSFADLEPNINLQNKLAGISKDLFFRNDDNDTYGDLIGWYINLLADEDDVPDRMIGHWFERIAVLASDTNPETRYIEGNQDYQKLVTVFLSGAINYFNATQFHLHFEQGMQANNTIGGSSTYYSDLQHQWDLALGYYGASRDIKTLKFQQVSSQGDNDSNQDQLIDLYSEFNFAYSLEASYRDRDGPLGDIKFTPAITQSQLNGRQLIDNQLNLTPSTTTEPISFQTETLLRNWEKVIAATILHYLNTTANDAALFKLDDLEYDEKHYITQWSALKAHALALQFSPFGTLSKQELIDVHTDLGTGPEISNPNFLNTQFSNYSNVRSMLIDKFEFSNESAGNW